MVEISEIVTLERLGAWLEDKPKDWSRQIALRAALRALPIWWAISRTNDAREIEKDVKRDMSCLPVLALAIRLSLDGEHRLISFEDKVAELLLGQVLYWAPVTDSNEMIAAFEARSSLLAAASDLDGFDVSAVNAVQRSARSLQIEVTSFLKSVREDCYSLQKGKNLFECRLWPTSNNVTETLWQKIKPTIPVAHDSAEEGNRPPPKEDWSFWVDWYDKVLEGKPQKWDLLYEIATSKEIDWGAGHLVANRQINEIVRRHSKPAEEPDLAEEVEAEKAAQPKPNEKVIERTRKAMGENRQSLPPTIDGLQEFILLEMKRWQESNELNATMPDECRRQVKNYLIMYEALEQLRAQIPEEGMPSKEQAEEAIGLTKLYLDKFKALPRDKADEVVSAIWERGGNVVDAGLILGTTGLCVQMGLSAQVGVAVGSVTFARKHAGDIIKAAKEYFAKSESGT